MKLSIYKFNSSTKLLKDLDENFGAHMNCNPPYKITAMKETQSIFTYRWKTTRQVDKECL